MKLTKDQIAKKIELYDKLSDLIEEVNSFIQETAGCLREEFDERSEKWQESDAGQEASSMVEAWEECEIPACADDLDLLPNETD